MILPDTSVWVEFARRGRKGRASDLAQLLSAAEVTTCGPVAAELLAGAEGETAERLAATLTSLPWASLDRAAWQDVGAASRRLRRAGESLPLTDVTIAVAAARAGCALWTFDEDFKRLTSVVEGLQLQ